MANPYQLIDLLTEVAGEGAEAKQGRGFHTFGHRHAVRDASGTELGFVQWGGTQGDLSMIEVKGERTPEAVKRLRERFWHRVTRVDACADFDAPGAFERLLGPCQEVKRTGRIYAQNLGDWEMPEKGRTYMMGAASSVARVRLYEKGKQPEYAHLPELVNLARLEVQVRPSKAAKTAYNDIPPAGVWGATRWTRELAGKVLQEHVDPHPAGTVYRQTDLERRLAWLCTQGGATLLELLEECGTWECVGLTLGEKVAELKARQ